MKQKSMVPHKLARHERRKIERYAETVFKRLMIQFIEFLGNKDGHSKEVQDKIAELNAKWCNHVDRTPAMIPAAKDELMKHINRIFRQ